MQADDFADNLSLRLAQFGGGLSESDVRRATKECRDSIYADSVAHGGRVEAPFFNFVVSNGVAVFTFFESAFSVYVLRCSDAQLVSEMNRFAMADTAQCKAFLAEQYHKASPDYVVSRAVCEYWLDHA